MYSSRSFKYSVSVIFSSSTENNIRACSKVVTDWCCLNVNHQIPNKHVITQLRIIINEVPYCSLRITFYFFGSTSDPPVYFCLFFF